MDTFYHDSFFYAGPRLFTAFLLLLGGGIFWAMKTEIFDFQSWSRKNFFLLIVGPGIILSAISYLIDLSNISKWFIGHLLMIWGIITFLAVIFFMSQK